MATIDVGDRVKVNHQYVDAVIVGREGTVVSVDNGLWPVGVRLDNNPYKPQGVGLFQFDYWEVEAVDPHIPAHEEAPC